jgi:endonuclease YncB( thermonuclease family)
MVGGCTTTDSGRSRATDDSSTGVVVQEVVDGDTLRLEDGSSVRLIGIDTPEREACGYEGAKRLLEELVRDGPVTLTRAPGQDTDSYDRLLRYVEVAGKDVAEELLREGWAIARYDSSDGYPAHPREDEYRRADAERADRGCYR